MLEFEDASENQSDASSEDVTSRRVNDWYLDAIIYQLHVKAFADSNNDGIGDLGGLIAQLDYIRQLGATAIWLLPFYPSPLRDDGYDIADYTTVNPSYGTMEDFRRLVEAAHERDLRVITELVINHTSDTHPWFQRARRAPAGSPERDFYVWSDTEDRYQGTRIIFIDSETSNWTWDPVAKAYFWHRFYSHQPDLNFDNPQVFDEVVKAMRFWLDLGVDGLRLDAVPYLCEREGTNNENLPETHAVLRRIRAEIDRDYPDRMLLAEANQWPEDTRPYFGNGDECHMAFHFPLMPRMYMALAQEDRHPITDILRQTPELPEGCQWALFLRNHDELTLEMVTAEERDYLWQTYAVDPRARINLGIRRRLAALMDNDRRKIELMNVLLLSMPGTPVLYYGDEIGMGDNFYLGDRDGVRTPMHWSVDRNAGFSRADPQRLYLPVLMDPVYGYQAVNVESQHAEPSSLLNWTRHMLGVRRRHEAFGRGGLRFLYPRNRKVIAFLREYNGQDLLVVANLSRTAQAVELDLSEFRGRIPVELGDATAFPPVGSAPYVLTMPAFGYFWFLLAEEAEMPNWYASTPEPLPRLLTLVMRGGWNDLLEDPRERTHLEKEILPKFLARQRWFSNKDFDIERVTIELLAPVGDDARHALAHGTVDTSDGTSRTFLMPLSLAQYVADENDQHVRPYALAMVRRGAVVSMLIDGSFSETLADVVMKAMRSSEPVETSRGRLTFDSTPTLTACPAKDETVKFVGAEQTNVSVVVGDVAIVKYYRYLEPGILPEAEMVKFLTEAGYRNTPRYLGSVDWTPNDGAATTLATAFEYISNQGDAWGVVTAALERLILDHGLAEGEFDFAGLTFPLDIGQKLGQRTAEMHSLLAQAAAPDAFAAQPVTRDDIATWIQETRADAERTFELLEASQRRLGDDAVQATVTDMLASRVAVEALLEACADVEPAGVKTRIHGDLHLGQVLVAQDDLYIIDFEGEPKRSLAERRIKTSPLVDVAGLLRSFDYAAWTASDRVIERGPVDEQRARALAFAWRDATVRGCIAAYASAAGLAYPNDAHAASQILRVFQLRKALYELRYELGSRPAWLSIPARGIMDLLRNSEEG